MVCSPCRLASRERVDVVIVTRDRAGDLLTTLDYLQRLPERPRVAGSRSGAASRGDHPQRALVGVARAFGAGSGATYVGGFSRGFHMIAASGRGFSLRSRACRGFFSSGVGSPRQSRRTSNCCRSEPAVIPSETRNPWRPGRGPPSIKDGREDGCLGSNGYVGSFVVPLFLPNAAGRDVIRCIRQIRCIRLPLSS